MTRVFQNIGVYGAYRALLARLMEERPDFDGKVRALVDDGFGGIHMLKPAIAGDSNFFYTSGDFEPMQKHWAREQGVAGDPDLADILLMQIEHHRTEIFYNLDPVRYGDAFLARLPGCVKRTIAWRAAPSGGAAFLKHDLVVNNYPSLAAEYERQGAKTAFFFPGHDPKMDQFADAVERPLDILFIGGYTRHHMERAAALEAVAALSGRYNVAFNLDVSRATRLAEGPAGWIGPLRKLRRPSSIREISQPPLFGLDMYRQIGRAKLVLNGKVDISGIDRGNMRLWETLGCGAALVTDDGRYPVGMAPGQDFSIYTDTTSLIATVERLLNATDERQAIAKSGRDMIRTSFNKDVQWARFLELC